MLRKTSMYILAGTLAMSFALKGQSSYTAITANAEVKIDQSGVVNSGSRAATIELEAALQAGRQILIPVKLPGSASLRINTGRGSEHFSLVNHREFFRWDIRSPDGTNLKNAIYWQRQLLSKRANPGKLRLYSNHVSLEQLLCQLPTELG